MITYKCEDEVLFLVLENLACSDQSNIVLGYGFFTLFTALYLRVFLFDRERPGRQKD